MNAVLRGAVAVIVTVATLGLAAPAANAIPSQRVSIDVRPGSTDNAISVLGRPGVPVAILTTGAFDAMTVDPGSVCFGDAENATQRDCTEAHSTGHPEDVDADGDTDLLLHYGASTAGLDAGDTQACLEGATFAGARIHGCDSVVVRNGTPETELPDLAPSVVADPTSTGPGGVVVWTATLGNEGTGAITFAPGTRVLRLTVPGALGATSVAVPTGFSCAAAGADAFDCTNDDPETLLVGGTQTFALRGTMPNAPGPVTVNASADPGNVVVESDETDNTRGATSVVAPGNLTTTLLAAPAALAPGESFQLTATVTNTGTVAAHVPSGTTLMRFTLPTGFVAGAAAAPPGFSCSGLSCTATASHTMAVNGQFVFTLAAQAGTEPGSYTARAHADPSSALDESDEGDNAASADLLVELPNLVTTVTTVADPVGSSGPVEWTSELLNLGPGKVRIASGVRAISFTLSEALSGVSVTGPAGFTCSTVSATEYACDTTAPATLLAGERRAFRLRGTAPANPGTVTLTTTADPANAVREADETDNASSSSARVVRVNLTVTAAARADPVDAVASTTWDVTISNPGGAVDIASGTHLLRFSWPAGFTNVAVSTPAGYSCFIVAANTADCAATTAITIPAGGTVPVTVFGTSPRQPGSLTLSFSVDPLDVVDESNENDNSTTATTTVQPPDFSMGLTVSPAPAEAGFTTTWVARITNDGPSNARISTGMTVIRIAVPSGMTNLAVSTPAGYTCFLSGTLLVDCQTTSTQNLAAGAHLDITFFGSAPREPGTISLTATADPLNAIPEGDETDNSATQDVLVRAPDLTASLSVTPAPANASHSTTWSARITNVGPSRARVPSGTELVRFAVPAGMTNLAVSTPTGFTCFIVETNVVDCETTTSMTLAVDQVIDVTFFGTAPKTLGTISMTVTADPLGRVPEEVETNNSATQEVLVQGPDFSIAMTVTPDPANASHSTTWVARITNDGPAPARIPNTTTLIRFNVPTGMTNLAVSTPAGFTCHLAATAMVECDATATTSLAVGAHLDVTLFGTAPRQLGPISVTATAEPKNTIPEEDESDNAVTTTVNVQGPDFSIAMTVSPDPANASHSTTWVARITNDGPAPARIPNTTTVIRFNVPSGMTNLAVSTPAGFTCYLAAAQVVECDATATTSLAVGAHLDITLFGTAPRALAPISVTATADPEDTIPEEDETDNAVTTTVAVQGPDFATTLTPASATVARGAVATWTARVTNEGPAPARISSAIDLIRLAVPADLASPTVTAPSGYSCIAVDAATFECNPTTTQTIAVGSFVEFVVSGNAPPSAGTLSVTATADPSAAIPEDDETNNAATAAITVT